MRTTKFLFSLKKSWLTWDEIDYAEDPVDRLPGSDGRYLAAVGLMPHLVADPVHHQQRLHTTCNGTYIITAVVVSNLKNNSFMGPTFCVLGSGSYTCRLNKD